MKLSRAGRYKIHPVHVGVFLMMLLSILVLSCEEWLYDPHTNGFEQNAQVTTCEINHPPWAAGSGGL